MCCHRKWHHIGGRCVSSCLMPSVAWLLLTSSDATICTVKQEVSVRVLLPSLQDDSPQCSLPVSPSSSLHPVRLLWIPGGFLQHGFPYDGLLGLWEPRGHCGHAPWRQTILSSSFTWWPFKKRWNQHKGGPGHTSQLYVTYLNTWRRHEA